MTENDCATQSMNTDGVTIYLERCREATPLFFTNRLYSKDGRTSCLKILRKTMEIFSLSH